MTILLYNSLDPRGVWLSLREATPSTAHKTCEFLNSTRLLPMLRPLFLFLFFLFFCLVLIDSLSQVQVWTLGSWQVSPPAYIVQY